MVDSEMDVDAVYTWVNHADPEWRSLYDSVLAVQEEGRFFHASVNSAARFHNRDELVFSIKSIRRYAPWIRRIYIVTNCSLPAELSAYPQVVRVDHKDIFPDTSVLPTFNSRAIEANLHKIHGLSERFIYFNDDVFLCKPVRESDFYSDDGKAFVYPSKHDVPYNVSSGLRPVDYGILNACGILIRDFGFKPLKKLHHAPFPLLKSTLLELDDRYASLLDQTRTHRFREKSDLPLATTLHAYYSLVTGRASFREVEARYIDIGDPLFVFLIHPYSPIRRGKYTFLCLNEVTEIRSFQRLRDRIVRNFMREMFDER